MTHNEGTDPKTTGLVSGEKIYMYKDRANNNIKKLLTPEVPAWHKCNTGNLRLRKEFGKGFVRIKRNICTMFKKRHETSQYKI
ncbi:hypothetical protein XELAEV_18019877mg [Xenopus laevis]|uniref:Uncharacterized protein n=1 Tax=Xenopus laevis TaxID=8355 RepID=A0A974D5T7_XENLA|nr:hypothetical protein XELAEV_18019877mg [Xenopus laevis]